MDSEEYWSRYYSRQSDGDNPMTLAPSTFASFVATYLKANSPFRVLKVLDVGCGNGRDLNFFRSFFKTPDTVGIDVCCDAVTFVREQLGLEAFAMSIGDFGVSDLAAEHDLVYSRFSLHSIGRDEQDKFFDWAARLTRCLAIETRSVNDPRFGKGKADDEDPCAFNDTHYRRFTRLSDLTEELTRRGFDIVHASEDFKSAATKTDKAVVNRIIAINTSEALMKHIDD